DRMISFASDNHSGVHPSIMEAIIAANSAHQIAYGGDEYTERAVARIREVLGVADAKVFFTFNGTGSNILALQAATPRYGSIICADTAHINVDECGAPERMIGCKVVAVPNVDGKLTPENAAKKLEGFDFEHHSQPSCFSIAQSTELGTCYTEAEIAALSAMAHKNGMYLHLDGARLANAVVSSGLTAAQMVRSVDVMSFGGTKNGMMMGEAVVVLNPSLGTNLKYERKQASQLSSKMRYVGAQFERYLADDLWLAMARHSNAMAGLLYSLVKDYVQVTQVVESNAVFAILPSAAREELLGKWVFYDWDVSRGEVRWMCSFDTTEADVRAFAADVAKAVSHAATAHI
ncbi:MAG: low specificity L-threonine aldolase, partial [Mucinivorans sp.]